MSLEEWVIAVIRIAGSLPVLRWAFAGALIAIAVDLSDLFLKNYLDLGGVSDYQSFDKWLDQVYLLAFFVVALRWPDTPMTVAVGLFCWRLAGFFTFEAVGERSLLLFFPNVFEFWFVFVAWQLHYRPGFAYSRRNTLAVLAICTALKLAQEYILHQAEWLDAFSTRDLIEALGG